MARSAEDKLKQKQIDDLLKKHVVPVNKYLNNPKLKAVNQKIAMTQEQIGEFAKCASNPEYFIEKYIKIITLDFGLVPIKLFDYQKEIIKTYHDKRSVILKAARQSGKSTVSIGYIVWYMLFNAHKTTAILANREATAIELLTRIKIAYQEIPLWLQQGVSEWNKKSLELENGTRILAESTSSGAIRGFSINLLYLDEFAHVPNHVAEEFFTSVYPTISSGQTAKIIVTSTPKGMNLFYRFWTDAINKRNDFLPINVTWREVPGRDEAWKKKQLAVLGEQKFDQEMECEFLGSAGTLIKSAVLKTMAFKDAIQRILDGMDIIERAIPAHQYIIAVDTARGTGNDYSAFVVIDVSEIPYRVVAKYRNNHISAMLYPNMIQQAAIHYNNAYLLIENNDLGAQVADTLLHDLGYDNMFYTMSDQHQEMTATQQSKAKTLGVKTTKKVKSQGCNAIKTIIENNQILITDFHIIEELSTFILKKTGYYAAEEGHNDDLAMCLVLFGWLTTQPIFKELTDGDMRKKIYEERMRAIEESMPPLPTVSSLEYDKDKYNIEDNCVWEVVGNDRYGVDW